MIIKVKKHNLISLHPQCDSDSAFLGLWAEMEARMAGSTLGSEANSVTEIIIQFQPKEGKQTDDQIDR